jgi:transposase
MTFITYKKFGKKEYAYEVMSYWDKKVKQPRHKTKYLGVVIDKEKKIFQKTLRKKLSKDELILDFGDTFLLQKFLENEGFIRILENSFGSNTNMLFNLLSYKLCHPSAMRLAEIWQRGNIIKSTFKAELKSQRISDLMVEIGNENNYRNFFSNFLSFVNSSQNTLLFDITAMPNQIHIPFSQWGYHDEEINKEINLMLVVDKESSLPLFFRYIPGSIPDVSCLKPTIDELSKYGIKNTCAIFDAGFYSESNIKALQGPDPDTTQVQFMVRLPSNRTLYKELMDKSEDLESIKYATVYGKRGLFIKWHKIDLFGKIAFAYIVLDPERKGRETRKLILGIGEKDEVVEDRDFLLKRKGIMVLISSIDLPIDEVVPFYYSRQAAEQLFKFSKDDLELLPLRTHNEESMRGYLLLVFITLIVFLLLKKRLGKKTSVEEALLILRNLKAKVFKDEIIIQELTKEQRQLFERFDIIVPKELGI